MPSLCLLQCLKLVVCVGLSPARPAVHVWLFRRRSLSCCHSHSEAEKKRFQTSEIFQVSCRLLCQMLIYRVRPPPAKYVQVFRISGAPVSVWCFYCTPASHVFERGPAAPTARPHQPRVQPEWADRAVNRWLPEFVFKHSLVCTLSFSIFIYLSFLESHTWQPQELIARQMRSGNNGKGVVGCLGLSDLDALLVNSIFWRVSTAYLLMRHQ